MPEENIKNKFMNRPRGFLEAIIKAVYVGKKNDTGNFKRPVTAVGVSAAVFLMLISYSTMSFAEGSVVNAHSLRTWIIAALLVFIITSYEASKTRAFDNDLRRKFEQRLKYTEQHDQLTGFYNRIALKERIDTLVEEEGRKCAIVFLDIDNFKYINDAMGHTYGDQLLKKISERLSQPLDGVASFYRLGGDEFIVVLEEFKDMEQIRGVAAQILNRFRNPIEINGSSIFVTVSIGAALSPEHGSNLDDLLKNADMAVNKAKETGKNTIIFYNQMMNETVNERVLIEKCLHTALENKEFELYYQPQLDINTGKVTGFEALLRWKSDELGSVSPLKFIGIAEDTHLIIPIGSWVVREACAFIRKIHKLGFTDVSVSVNISMLQLLQEDFVDMILEVLERTEVEAECLELEITETILMKSYEVIADKLVFLRSRGVKIALDDFGKGYSSLNYLRELPISTLKIDKSFIDMINFEDKNKSLTDLIVKAGKRMDLCVVAEGVETQEQMDYLVKYQCNKIQGYLFSKPLSHNEAADVLTRNMKEVGA